MFLSADFWFKITFYESILSERPSECQTVWIHIKPEVFSDLTWVQTVCKRYQQTKLVGAELILYLNNVGPRLIASEFINYPLSFRSWLSVYKQLA